ncbi:unnamed protein product, partial [Ectocarpus sp. 13 AM-2016]
LSVRAKHSQSHRTQTERKCSIRLNGEANAQGKATNHGMCGDRTTNTTHNDIHISDIKKQLFCIRVLACESGATSSRSCSTYNKPRNSHGYKTNRKVPNDTRRVKPTFYDNTGKFSIPPPPPSPPGN